VGNDVFDCFLLSLRDDFGAAQDTRDSVRVPDYYPAVMRTEEGRITRMPFSVVVVYDLSSNDLDRENLGTYPEQLSW
jgi:hypothetical protein